MDKKLLTILENRFELLGITLLICSLDRPRVNDYNLVRRMSRSLYLKEHL